ncbi:hypothetical protein HOH87_05255 [bacterium]|nr:hypothetical protein [bacterium]
MGRFIFLALLLLTSGYIYRDAIRRGNGPFLASVWSFAVVMAPVFALPIYMGVGLLRSKPSQQSASSNNASIQIAHLCSKCGHESQVSLSECPKCHNKLTLD